MKIYKYPDINKANQAVESFEKAGKKILDIQVREHIDTLLMSLGTPPVVSENVYVIVQDKKTRAKKTTVK